MGSLLLICVLLKRQTSEKQSQDGTNLKRRNRQRLVELIQGDEGEKGWDSTILLLLCLHQRAGIYHHLNFHWLVADKCESPGHSHHTAWEEKEDDKKNKDVKGVYCFVFFLLQWGDKNKSNSSHGDITLPLPFGGLYVLHGWRRSCKKAIPLIIKKFRITWELSIKLKTLM